MSNPNEPRLIRRFSEVLGMIDRGKLEASLNEALRESLETIRAQPGEKGKATITLTVEVAAQGEMVQLKPKLTVKLPEGGGYAPLVLWDHEGALTAQHPNQLSMFTGPREAPAAEEAPKAAAGE